MEQMMDPSMTTGLMCGLRDPCRMKQKNQLGMDPDVVKLMDPSKLAGTTSGLRHPSMMQQLGVDPGMVKLMADV
eukprot:12612347-Alexandrium_andersonii.AAC.1